MVFTTYNSELEPKERSCHSEVDFGFSRFEFGIDVREALEVFGVDVCYERLVARCQASSFVCELGVEIIKRTLGFLEKQENNRLRRYLLEPEIQH